jgi:outer membrane protein OmpA-like peptidoglycan-associated protein
LRNSFRTRPEEKVVKKVMFVTSLAATAFVVGCASTPKAVPQLDSARAQVHALEKDPMAGQAASRELEGARSRLRQAELALKEGREVGEVEHLAYLAQRQAETGQARIQEARAKEQLEQGEAERNRVLLEARTREAQRAAQQARTAEAEALAAKASAESAQQELADLQAKQTERGMVLTLSDVLFDTNAATLKPGADLAIERLVQFLNENPETRIIIEGHTDSRGSEQYNQDLSRRRAQAVSDALVSRGIASSRFEVLGRGEAFPVASNDTASGRQQNRRVEIVFSDASGRFAQGSAQPVQR